MVQHNVELPQVRARGPYQAAVVCDLSPLRRVVPGGVREPLGNLLYKLKIGLKFGEITGRLEMQYKYIGQCQGQWKQTKL